MLAESRSRPFSYFSSMLCAFYLSCVNFFFLKPGVWGPWNTGTGTDYEVGDLPAFYIPEGHRVMAGLDMAINKIPDALFPPA